MGIIVGVDTFGGVADKKILPANETGFPLKNRDNNLFGNTGIYRRLKNNNRIPLEVPANGCSRRSDRPDPGLLLLSPVSERRSSQNPLL